MSSQQFFATARALYNNPVALVVVVQALFVLIGIGYLGFTIAPLEVLLIVGVAIATEITCANLQSGDLRRGRGKFFFPTSAVAAGLGIVLFFRATSPWLYVLAAFLAIASKYALRLDSRHVFNPSNFAIVATVFLFPYAATIEFTQWGSNPTLYVCFLALLLAVGYRSGTLLTTFAFLASYAAVLCTLVLYAPDFFMAHHYGLLGPSLLLFATFMITDPKTTPRAPNERMVHGVTLTSAYFFLELLGIRYALFVASFAVSTVKALLRLAMRVYDGNWSRTTFFFTATVCAVSVSFFTVAAVPVMQKDAVLSWPDVSLSFLLLGTESNGVRSCSASPTFQRPNMTGIDTVGNNIKGAAWGDYDDDGFDDLFVSSRIGRLYHNKGDGTFEEATFRTGLPSLSASSGIWADYDNDGRPDLFVVEHVPGPDNQGRASLRVFKNTRGGFVEVTEKMGFSSFPNYNDSSSMMSFADYNNDGRLDLTLTTSGSAFYHSGPKNFPFRKSRRDPFFDNRATQLVCGEHSTNELLKKFPHSAPSADSARFRAWLAAPYRCISVGSSISLTNAVPDFSDDADHAITAWFIVPGEVFMFENTGAGFERRNSITDTVHGLERDASATGVELLPFSMISGRFWQPVSFDYDSDSLPDIFLNVDDGSSLLLKNMGNFIFKDVTAAAGLQYWGTGMGSDVADIDHTGTLDLISTNVLEDYLYVNLGGGLFRNKALDGWTIGAMYNGWSAVFLDYDLDGWDDVYIENGISETYSGTADMRLTRPIFNTQELHKNDAGTGFLNVTGKGLCPRSEVGYIAAMSDYDRDGDPDIFVGTRDSGGYILQNNIAHTGKHYLRVHLRGTASNAMAVGATVSVSTQSGTQMKTLLAGSGVASQNSSVLLFGLGEEQGALRVRVHWPSGNDTTVVAYPDEDITITE
ncbi:MAG TPA: FG-GAP-like repeat-containing protein [Candidatus Paceibacterota bacterium]